MARGERLLLRDGRVGKINRLWTAEGWGMMCSVTTDGGQTFVVEADVIIAVVR